jgi:hypothetical protein
MTRFATIDMHSGYVWWVGDAESAIDACIKSDAEAGDWPNGEYGEVARGDATARYAVYEVPAGFDVTDGQDEAQIAATVAHRRVGFYRAADAQE